MKYIFVALMILLSQAALAQSTKAEPISTADSQAQAELSMVMVSQPGCYYCRKWLNEIAPIYPKTDLGKTAPLAHIDIKDSGQIALLRPVVFTPTFLFVRGGKELARIEGYTSEDFFWALGEQYVGEILGVTFEGGKIDQSDTSHTEGEN